MTAVTAITAQNTTGVKSVVPIPPKEIEKQILFTSKDIKPDAVKIGMLHSSDIILSVSKSLKKLQTNIRNNETLVNKIFVFVREKKANIDKNFSVIVNIGPGSFSGIRISLAVAKGIKITKGSKLYGYKDQDLADFNAKNIKLLIKNKFSYIIIYFFTIIFSLPLFHVAEDWSRWFSIHIHLTVFLLFFLQNNKITFKTKNGKQKQKRANKNKKKGIQFFCNWMDCLLSVFRFCSI